MLITIVTHPVTKMIKDIHNWYNAALYKSFLDERIRGSHHIFTKEGIEEILNLQSLQGKAKTYQVKQIRDVILKYKLGGQDENSL